MCMPHVHQTIYAYIYIYIYIYIYCQHIQGLRIDNEDTKTYIRTIPKEVRLKHDIKMCFVGVVFVRPQGGISATQVFA
jgi:hypothetical protein